MSEQITDMSDQNQFCSDTTATHILGLYYALHLACTK